MKTIAFLTMAHALVKFLSWQEERRLSRGRHRKMAGALGDQQVAPRDYIMRNADGTRQPDRRTLANYVSPLY